MTRLILRLKGGPGSGHRGHAGRPGQRGGSVTGAGGGGASSSLSPESRIELAKKVKSGVTYTTESGGRNYEMTFFDKGERDGREVRPYRFTSTDMDSGKSYPLQIAFVGLDTGKVFIELEGLGKTLEFEGDAALDAVLQQAAG